MQINKIFRLVNSDAIPNFRVYRQSVIVAMLGLSCLALCESVMADSAASEPAVSEPNAKVSVQGASLDGRGAGIVSGLFTAPIGHSFGVQIDAQAGLVNSEAYWGTGAHLFWRDPSVGMLGVTYSYQQWSNFNFGWLDSNTQIIKDATLHRGGVQGELYLSRFTLSGYAGYQDGNVPEGAYGQLKLGYYATDDLSLHVTGDHFAGYNMIRGGVEYRPNFTALPNLALFAEGGYATHEYGLATAGIRYYFGKSTPTLIHRDRHSDPLDTWSIVPGSQPGNYTRPVPPPPPCIEECDY